MTPRDDIRKTLDFFELGGLRLGELALRSACPWEARASRPPPAPDLSTGALSRRAAASGWRQPGSLACSRRRGDNAGMARDTSKARFGSWSCFFWP